MRALLSLVVAFVALGCGPRTPPASSTAAAPEREAMVVATIHKGHLMQARYPLGLLCRIVDAYRPDLVMVEVRPEPFALGHYEDGPFEMTAVTLCARRHKIEVAPIDWWLESDMSAAPPALSADEEKAMNAELARLEEPTWPAFDLANSERELRRGLEVLNVQARYLGGNPVWTRRQAWFHHRALEAIDRSHARRALAFVGLNHAPELSEFLAALGMKPVSPLSLPLGDLSRANDAMPDDVVAAWSDGLSRLRASVESSDGESKQRYAAKVRYFETAVARKGRCCVREP